MGIVSHNEAQKAQERKTESGHSHLDSRRNRLERCGPIEARKPGWTRRCKGPSAAFRAPGPGTSIQRVQPEDFRLGNTALKKRRSPVSTNAPERESTKMSGFGLSRGRAVCGSELEDGFAHFLAGFEFHHRARRNADVIFRSVWISADAGFTHFHFEDSEVSQFHLLPLSNSFGDVVERFLNHFEDALLDQAGFVADTDHQVSFCHRPLRLVVLFCCWAYDGLPITRVASTVKPVIRAKRASGHPHDCVRQPSAGPCLPPFLRLAQRILES